MLTAVTAPVLFAGAGQASAQSPHRPDGKPVYAAGIGVAHLSWQPEPRPVVGNVPWPLAGHGGLGDQGDPAKKKHHHHPPPSTTTTTKPKASTTSTSSPAAKKKKGAPPPTTAPSTGAGTAPGLQGSGNGYSGYYRPYRGGDVSTTSLGTTPATSTSIIRVKASVPIPTVPPAWDGAVVDPLVLAQNAWNGLALNAGTDVVLPITFLIVAGLFLLLQAFIDRRDPKVLEAPERHFEDMVSFE